jgi:hypothetical protein
MDIDWDSAPVINDSHSSFGKESHAYFGAITSERFIDGVIDDLINQVM